MSLVLTTFKTTNTSYWPLVTAKPAWKLDYSGNVWDALMDYLQANAGLGTVTNTAGALASGALVVGNGSNDAKTPNSATTLDANGNLVTAGYVAPGSAASSGNNVTLASGANQNIAIGNKAYIRLVGPSAPFSLGGFSGGVDGRRLTVINVAVQTMTINHQDSGSSAANRIYTLSNTNVVLRAGANSAANFVYDITDGGWILVSVN